MHISKIPAFLLRPDENLKTTFLFQLKLFESFTIINI